MFIPASINGVTAAFILGLATSPHCALMCGPLGCAVLTAGRPQATTLPAMAAYQSARLSAYAVVGSLAGGIGTVTEKAFTRPVTQALPWVLVTLLLIFGLRMDRWLPKPIWLSRWHGRMMSWSRNTPAPLLGAMLGLATPFLPCGPLYVLFLVCLFTGSAVQGATLALAFGLGTLPLLWAVQTGLARWQIRLSPGLVRWAQSGVALLAAGIVAWRALVVSPDWLEALCH